MRITFVNNASKTSPSFGSEKLRMRSNDNVERGYAERRYGGDEGDDMDRINTRGKRGTCRLVRDVSIVIWPDILRNKTCRCKTYPVQLRIRIVQNHRARPPIVVKR